MAVVTARTSRLARVALGLIRLLNGSLALFAPDVLGRRLGVHTRTSPGLGYSLRLFGVRTILLGISLLKARADPRASVVHQAILVHSADTLAAVVVFNRCELPRRGAILAIAASAINVGLAILANVPSHPSPQK